MSESELEKLESPELFQLYNSMFLYFSNYMKAFGGKSKKENCTQAIASMKQLATSQDIVTQTLASYFLGRTYLKYESEPGQGISYFQFLSDFYPKNKRFPALLEACKSKAK